MNSAAADEAAVEFDEVLGYRTLPIYRVGLLYRAGEAHAAAGAEESAIAYWRMALQEEPASNPAYQSLIQLVNRNVPVDLFLRGQIDLHAGAYDPAIYVFRRFIEEEPASARAGEAWLGIARSHMGLGQWEAARLAIDHVLNAYPDCACYGEAWMARAQVAAGQGAPAAARRIYRTFARDYAEDPLAPQALWLSALSSLDADAEPDVGAAAIDPFDEAVADLLRLVETFPASQQAADGLAVAGMGAFEQGRYGQAAGNFARLLADYPDGQTGAAAYWLGRARYALGETEAARSLWEGLAAGQPETYYGLLAAIELLSRSSGPGQDLVARLGSVAAVAPTLAGDDGSRAFAERWLAERHGAAQSVVEDDADLVGGQQLLALGLRAEGLGLLERAYWRYRDDPMALYTLMLRFEAVGANRLSISAAYRLITAPLPGEDASGGVSPAFRAAGTPLFLQRMAYPRRFSYLVEGEAAEFGLDPLLLYSLIFQESLFEPPARSFAGAHGLMQIIPSTGAEIALRLGYPDYSASLLNRPYVNVRFGAFYLDWVRAYAHENDVAALAGYNAGPGNARIWHERTAPDEALFVELVPYAETRRYLQRILTHYYHYLRLYGFE